MVDYEQRIASDEAQLSDDSRNYLTDAMLSLRTAILDKAMHAADGAEVSPEHIDAAVRAILGSRKKCQRAIGWVLLSRQEQGKILAGVDLDKLTSAPDDSELPEEVRVARFNYLWSCAAAISAHDGQFVGPDIRELMDE